VKRKINPDYAIAYELHEFTPIKPIKYIGLFLDENVFQGLFAILKDIFWVLFE